jgi:hypothetical protein
MSSLASVSDRTLAALAKTGSSSSGPVALIISFNHREGSTSLLRLTFGKPDDVLQFCEMTVLNHPIGFIDTQESHGTNTSGQLLILCVSHVLEFVNGKNVPTSLDPKDDQG